MIEHKYKLVGHEVVPCADIYEWGAWFEKADRLVMVTKLIDGSRISTFFLGIDIGWEPDRPMLFETALFSGEKDYNHLLRRFVSSNCEVVGRYSTWAEAVEGHMQWIEQCVPNDMIEATVKEST